MGDFNRIVRVDQKSDIVSASHGFIDFACLFIYLFVCLSTYLLWRTKMVN